VTDAESAGRLVGVTRRAPSADEWLHADPTNVASTADRNDNRHRTTLSMTPPPFPRFPCRAQNCLIDRCPRGRDTRAVSEIVDPTPIVEERIAAELGPLREELSDATESKERKRIQREMRRQEKRIRREVLGRRALW
jgi:hypothetical protein